MSKKLQYIKCTTERLFNITLIVMLSALFTFGYIFIQKLDVQSARVNKVIADAV